MYKYLQDTQKEYIISKQIFRSGTSIGANVREARNAQSRADFSNKMNIALKEADETAYWLELLHKAEFIDDEMFCSIYDGKKGRKNLIGFNTSKKAEFIDDEMVIC